MIDELSAPQVDKVRSARRVVHERILAQAIVCGRLSTWRVPTVELSPTSNLPEYADARGDLYGGTAGIALALTESEFATASSTKQMIEGALRHAIEFAHDATTAHCSFHSGSVGVVYALIRAAERLRLQWCVEAALELLRSLRCHIEQEAGDDVISGAAGAIPVLLAIEDKIASFDIAGLCSVMGRDLLQRAVVVPDGLVWRSGMIARRGLTGLAHGSAGYSHALFQMYLRTGDPAYRVGFAQSVAYERSTFSAVRGNWPDYRNLELFEAVRLKGEAGLLDAPLEAMMDPAPRFSTAWCHGAPGIGLSRLHALGRWKLDSLSAEVTSAVDATLQCGCPSNASLCHGLVGNAELLRLAGKALQRREWVLAARRWVLDACERYGGAHQYWPSGARGAAPSVSLLCGESGVGLFLDCLLRDKPVEILLPQRVTLGRQIVRTGAEATSVDMRLARRFFGRTMKLSSFTVPRHQRTPEEREFLPIPRLVAEEAHKKLEVAQHTDEVPVDWLVDAAAFEVASDYPDESVVRAVDARGAKAACSASLAKLRLMPSSNMRIVRMQSAEEDETNPQVVAVVGTSLQVSTYSVGALAALVLQSAAKSTTLQTLTADIASEVHVTDARELAELEALVERQCRELLRVGVLAALD